jgi:hypothetical protein
MHDERVNAALDLTIYLDITDDVKFAWKAQRDIAERGATMEEVQKAINDRKPDFSAYVEPQKAKADIIIQASRELHIALRLRLPKGGLWRQRLPARARPRKTAAGCLSGPLTRPAPRSGPPLRPD